MAMMTQSSFLTQANLDLYKAEFPEDDRLQKLSLKELLDNTRGVTLDHMVAPRPPGNNFDVAVVVMSASSTAHTITPCVQGIAKVIFDAVLLVTGAVALARKIAQPVVTELGVVANIAASKLGKIISKMTAPNATKSDLAKGFAEILKAIKEAKLFKKMWEAFTKSLTWYYAVLYGVVVLATIAALVTSGGTLILAEFVLLLTSCAFMAIDVADAATACQLAKQKLSKHAPTATPVPNTNPYVTEPHGGLKTVNGYFLTFVNGGGLAGNPGGSALLTNAQSVGSAADMFELVPINKNDYSFAIRFVASPNMFLSALNGGGVSIQPAETCPVQTMSTTMGPDETIALVQQPNADNTFAFCLPNGQYACAADLSTAISGPLVPVTTATPGPNETFTFVRVPPPPS